MIKKLFSIFSHKKEPERDFSTFFRKAPREEKERLLKDVAHKANQDQREVAERYDRMITKTVQ